jgi:hypothetical protein
VVAWVLISRLLDRLDYFFEFLHRKQLGFAVPLSGFPCT